MDRHPDGGGVRIGPPIALDGLPERDGREAGPLGRVFDGLEPEDGHEGERAHLLDRGAEGPHLVGQRREHPARVGDGSAGSGEARVQERQVAALPPGADRRRGCLGGSRVTHRCRQRGGIVSRGRRPP